MYTVDFQKALLIRLQFLGKLSHTWGQGCAEFDWLELDGQMKRGDMPVGHEYAYKFMNFAYANLSTWWS